MALWSACPAAAQPSTRVTSQRAAQPSTRSLPAPAFCQRRSVRAAASRQPIPDLVQGRSRLALLAAVADLCELQGLTAKYESLAGRSAMLGVGSALLLELLTQESVVRPLDSASAEVAVGITLTCLAAAGIAAAVQGRAARTAAPFLLEPVLTSLTAVQRSACGVSTGADTPERLATLDLAVDEVMTHAFTRDTINLLTDASAYEDF